MMGTELQVEKSISIYIRQSILLPVLDNGMVLYHHKDLVRDDGYCMYPVCNYLN